MNIKLRVIDEKAIVRELGVVTIELEIIQLELRKRLIELQQIHLNKVESGFRMSELSMS